LLFNSYEFIFIFLPITFFIYFYLNKKHFTQASKGFLVFASLFFYSYWNIIYLPLILVSMFFNFTLGKLFSVQHKKKRRYSKKMLLGFGVSANLALLGYFKYTDFFLINFNRVTGLEVPLLHLALPLAISFYTFQQIAYLVDSYKGETSDYDFLNYALFVTFFPQLIAGPIVHHAEMMPQFAKLKNKVKNYQHIAVGLFLFFMGLFKKVVIGDTFANWANQGFAVADKLNMLEAWIASLSYTFHIYFDFSGYTDMAIGAALLFNIKLPKNFFSPYKATSIQDFWRRWHITLSRFLRDYLYIPLGGNRKTESRTYLNLFTTFVLGGIWHGAGWTFVLWGMLHGMGLIVQRIWQKVGIHMPRVLAWFITFNFVNIAWVFFNAENFHVAKNVLKNMFTGTFVMPLSLIDHVKHFSKLYQHETYLLLWMLGAFILVLFFPNSMELKKRFKPNFFYMGLTVIFFLAVFLLYRKSEFIYFNF